MDKNRFQGPLHWLILLVPPILKNNSYIINQSCFIGKERCCCINRSIRSTWRKRLRCCWKLDSIGDFKTLTKTLSLLSFQWYLNRSFMITLSITISLPGLKTYWLSWVHIVSVRNSNQTIKEQNLKPVLYSSSNFCSSRCFNQVTIFLQRWIAMSTGSF